MTDVDTSRRAIALLNSVHRQTCFEAGDHPDEVDTAYSLGADALQAIAALPPAVHYCPSCGNAHLRGVDRFCDKCLRDDSTTPDPVAEAKLPSGEWCECGLPHETGGPCWECRALTKDGEAG